MTDRAALPKADLTKRQLEILRLMRDAGESEDGELCYEHGEGWLGSERVHRRTVFALLRACAISADQFNKGDMERYHINETGRQILEQARY
jgi:hypothetical protein